MKNLSKNFRKKATKDTSAFDIIAIYDEEELLLANIVLAVEKMKKPKEAEHYEHTILACRFQHSGCYIQNMAVRLASSAKEADALTENVSLKTRHAKKGVRVGGHVKSVIVDNEGRILFAQSI